MAFVNIHGKPWSPGASGRVPPTRTPALRRVQDPDKATVSMGFLVLGFSPEQIAEAEKEHDRKRAELQKREAAGHLDRNERVPPEWSEEHYLDKHKPRKLRSKPYELRDAADVCAVLAEKAGFKRVRVEEVLKG